MHDVQELRHALHLVQDYDAVAWDGSQLEGEQAGIGKELLVARCVEEVHDVRSREHLPGPGALPRPAHAEQEEAALRRGEETAVCAG